MGTRYLARSPFFFTPGGRPPGRLLQSWGLVGSRRGADAGAAGRQPEARASPPGTPLAPLRAPDARVAVRGQWSPPSRELHRGPRLPSVQGGEVRLPDTSAGWTTSGAHSTATFLRLLNAADTAAGAAPGRLQQNHTSQKSPRPRAVPAPRENTAWAWGVGHARSVRRGRREPPGDAPPVPPAPEEPQRANRKTALPGEDSVIARGAPTEPPPSDLSFRTCSGVGNSSLLQHPLFSQSSLQQMLLFYSR